MAPAVQFELLNSSLLKLFTLKGDEDLFEISGKNHFVFSSKASSIRIGCESIILAISCSTWSGQFVEFC